MSTILPTKPNLTADLDQEILVGHAHQSVTPCLPQRADIENLAKLIQSEMKQSPWNNAKHPSGVRQISACIDRGCGSGPNCRALTDAFRRCINGHTMSYYNERNPADFPGLATQVRMRNEQGACGYHSMICGSFLDQLLPNSSLDLVTSNAALHWIDLDHAAVGLPGFAAREDWCLSELADEQWRRFLTVASAELRTGGKLVVSFVAAQSESGSQDHIPLRLIEFGIDKVFGTVRNHWSRPPIPIHLRTSEQISAPFKDADRPVPLRLKRCRVESVNCPYFQAYESHRCATRYADEFTGFLRAFSESSLRHWCELGVEQGYLSPGAFKKIAGVYRHIHTLICSNPEEWRMKKHRAVVVAEQV
ncbi:class I SAM-dependent methyltransferase [Stieleria varia]|uniref:SAM dependent carboxyl methyltransferase n=1 Tax=Stieleria varia TaxID=2528005 RepID=A0A5C6BD46_9BACT|nr:hypothetical protein [Stieleria varia]TWU08364.1 SAM dependent carboxyl methyltransferase [Stieleria varia]